jgi:hypothetical protein
LGSLAWAIHRRDQRIEGVMAGPEKSADEKAEETRKQWEAKSQVTLETSKSFITWLLGLWAKFALGCLFLVIAFFVVSCIVIQQIL